MFHNSKGRFILLVVVILQQTLSFSQNDNPYGEVPFVKNYGVTDYTAQSQNWGLLQDNHRMMYFANNQCILVYDGENWSKVFLKDNVFSRSLSKSKDGTIYVGGANEFGYLSIDKKGKHFYTSLVDSSINRETIGNVWYSGEFKGSYYFFSDKGIFKLTEDKIETIEYPENLIYKKTVAFDKGFILTFLDYESDNRRINYVFDGKKFKIFKKLEENFTPVKIFKQDDGSYLTFTLEATVYVFKEYEEKNTYLIKKVSSENYFKIPKAVVTNVAKSGNIYCVTTSKEGVYLYNSSGKLIRKISSENGLENLEVIDCLFDVDNNLWLTNDNGISKIDLSTPITEFNKNSGIVAASEDILITDKQKVIGSRSGMFLLETNQNEQFFKNTEIISTECFSLIKKPQGDEFLIVGNDGLYQIDIKSKNKKILEYIYAWKLLPSKKNPNIVYVALENEGIGLLEKINNNWIYTGKVKGSDGNVRSMTEYKGQLYYSITGKGVAILDSNRTFKDNLIPMPAVDTSNTLSDFYLEVFRDTLMVGSSQGLMQFNLNTNTLVPYTRNDNYFNKTTLLVHRMFNENNHKLWMVLFHDSETEEEREEVGFLYKDETGKWKWESSELKTVSKDVINAFAIDENKNVWMAGGAGVYVYNNHIEKTITKPYPVYISKILLEDSLYHHYVFENTQSDLIIDYNTPLIRFEVGAPSFFGIEGNEYRFKLKGYKERWSDWSPNNWVEYTKLYEGTYTFMAQSRNYYGVESEIIEYTFKVLPPWYRTWWAYVLYFIGIILFMYLVIKLSIKRIKEQNIRLEHLVQERTAEITSKNEELEVQKAEIEEKNNDILSSIKYAERLQKAILPSKEKIAQYFPNHFVLFKPKDIVSGDFYWLQHIKPYTFFAAVDCTGHGVPGAIVSIVGNNGLNRCVNEFNLRDSGKILDQLSEIVTESFNAKGGEVKDGMDLSLCVYNHKNNSLHYSGANNSLFLIRKGKITESEFEGLIVNIIYDESSDSSLIEIKPDKQPIGSYDHKKPFKTNHLEPKEGDSIYLFSDGYTDQFGGESESTLKAGGKKFKSKAFKSLLLSIQHLSMAEQRLKLDEIIEKWRGDIEQIDDICVFGIKI